MDDFEVFMRDFENLISFTSPRVIKKDFSAPELINPEICSKCGGECCKRCGCEFSPDDFEEISFELLKKEIEKGYISIEYIDGEIIYQNFGGYILRARGINDPIVVRFRYTTNPCILLTENGCKLDFKNRPTGAKLLVPSEKKITVFGQERRCCYSDYGIKECYYEWRPYQLILHQLIDYFKEKDFTCTL